MNRKSCGTYNPGSEIEFNINMLRLILLSQGTITGARADAAERQVGKRYMQVTLTNCAPWMTQRI